MVAPSPAPPMQEKRANVKEDPADVANDKQLPTNASTHDSVSDANKLATSSTRSVSFFQLFRFATKFELTINLITLIAAAAAGAAQPLMTLLFGNLTNAFVRFGTLEAQAKGGDPSAQRDLPAASASFRHTAANDASYLVYIGVGSLVCTFLYMYVWVYTGEVNAKRIREHYLRATLRQEVAYFDKVGAGEVATRIQTDTHLVQQGISEKVALSVSFTSSFLTGFIMAYVRQWRLALAMTSELPCIAIAGGVMSTFVSKYMQLSLGHCADGGSLAEEVFSTVRTAQAFGIQKVLADRYDMHINKAKASDMKAAIFQGCGMAVFFFVIYGGYGLAFYFGTTLVNEGHSDAGEIVNVILAILFGSLSLAFLAPEMTAITQAMGAAAKLYETIDRIPDIDSASDSGLHPATCTGEIVFDHIKFNYPSRPDVPIVRDLSITFPAGKTTALVGASGSGKSTVVALVERFYDPLSGVIKLDGTNIRELNLKWLRTQIGLVSQEPTLFATTIRGNVAHGLIGTKWEHAPAEEQLRLITEACVKANADGFIRKLPLSYETLVGERGFLLSGGQKQRIAIARAIVSDPKILLLDEATSALDTQSEGIVQDALDKAAAGRTTITIAHRLSTIRDADCIYVLGEGRLLEAGTHDELLRDPGSAYSRLVAAQKLRDAHDKLRTSSGIETTYISGAEGQGTVDSEKLEEKEAQLSRSKSANSLTSQLAERREQSGKQDDRTYDTMTLFRRFFSINKESWRMYLMGSLAAICNGGAWPAFGIVYAKAIAGFQSTDPHQRRHDGDRAALWFFIIAIGAGIANGLQNYLFTLTAAQLTGKIRSLSFRAIVRQDIEYFDEEEHSTGQLASNLSDNPQKVNGLAGVTLGAIVQAVSTLICGIVIGIIFSWKLGLVALACAPAMFTTGYIRLKVVVLKDQRNKRAHEQSAQLACEAAGAIRTVASLTREEDCLRLYSESLEEPLRRSNRTALWSNLIYAMSQAMTFFVIALIFWYGSRLVSYGEISTFHFFVALMSSAFGANQAGNVFQFVPDVSSAKSAATDILTLFDSKPEIDAMSPEGEEPTNVEGQIRFEEVKFCYPTRPGVRVLRNFNMSVAPGTYVALVGPSGCGKSTTIQLIERFYDALSGTIYFDGQPITKFNVSKYRKNIALVSQEPTLYSGTIRDNILMGACKPGSEVTQEELETACRDANILDFIHDLPLGFDTEVGGKGSQLSGGQKQRIAIARALLRDPKVLLLDEATSALDSTSEKVVQEALDKAAKGRTTIAIAHRLSTIQNADRIYFIKEGAVSEYGTHDELIARRGGYYEYVQLQALK